MKRTFYYLTPAHWAKVILKNRRLKLSTIPELNDPFELLGASIGEKEVRRVMKVIYSHWVKDLGMVCFSETWQNPVMWAHYGDKHNGVCLGFQFEDAEPLQVRYEPDRLKGMLKEVFSNRNFTLQQLEGLLCTKFKDWEYEREHRIFARLTDREPKSGLYYLNIEPHLRLTEVILGARCKLSLGEAIKAVGSDGQASVSVFKARAAFDSFAIVRDRSLNIMKIKAAKKRPGQPVNGAKDGSVL